MASGKTTVGRALAERLGRPFSDSDDWIERTFGKTVQELADETSIDEMHRLEAAHLLRALAGPGPDVIAAAASTIDDPGCRSALSQEGVRVIWLKADPVVLAARFERKRHRPRFGRSPDDLMAEQAVDRETLFGSLDPIVIETDGSDPADTVAAALARLRAGGDDGFAP